MASSDDAFLVCLRVAGKNLIVRGSMKKKCSACAEAVWVSPASWELSQERKLPLLCMECAEERMAKDDDVQIQAPTKEQLKEAAETIKRDIIERN